MRIGLLGGTFDPIHKGHVHIALAALKEYKLDKVWFLPAGNPYFKAGTFVTPPKLRLDMVKAAIDKHEQIFDICDIEIGDTKETHTADTLIKLHRLYPDDEFYFIMGLDSLFMLYKWYRPDIILSEAVILCADRDRMDDTVNAADAVIAEEAEKLRCLYPDVKIDIRLIHTPWLDISSSSIRKKIRENKNVNDYVEESVLDIIKSNRLYSK